MTHEQMDELVGMNKIIEKHGEEVCQKAFRIFEKTQSTRAVANKLGIKYSDAVNMISAYAKY